MVDYIKILEYIQKSRGRRLEAAVAVLILILSILWNHAAGRVLIWACVSLVVMLWFMDAFSIFITVLLSPLVILVVIKFIVGDVAGIPDTPPRREPEAEAKDTGKPLDEVIKERSAVDVTYSKRMELERYRTRLRRELLEKRVRAIKKELADIKNLTEREVLEHVAKMEGVKLSKMEERRAVEERRSNEERRKRRVPRRDGEERRSGKDRRKRPPSQSTKEAHGRVTHRTGW